MALAWGEPLTGQPVVFEWVLEGKHPVRPNMPKWIRMS